MKTLSQQTNCFISLTTSEINSVAGADSWNLISGAVTIGVGFGLTGLFLPAALPLLGAGTALYAGTHAINDFRKKWDFESAANIAVDKASYCSFYAIGSIAFHKFGVKGASHSLLKILTKIKTD